MTNLVAFCYDFDKTLTQSNMQEQGLISSLGMTTDEFWGETDRMSLENGMDGNLSYMRLLCEKSAGRFPLTRDRLMGFGKGISFFPGVVEWFGKINSYALRHGLEAEHYIISCGTKEIIDGTAIAGNFKRIYASSYLYGRNGEAIWPAQVVNFTNKTQFLYRIKKGALDVNDMSVNDFKRSSDIRIPFERFIYIGDSDTDIPCMSIVNGSGGFSIGVYDPAHGSRPKVEKLLCERRISYFAPADYTEGSQLYKIACAAIDKISCDMRLSEITGKLASGWSGDSSSQWGS